MTRGNNEDEKAKERSSSPAWLRGQRRGAGIRSGAEGEHGDLPRTRSVQFRDVDIQSARTDKRRNRRESGSRDTDRVRNSQGRRDSEGESGRSSGSYRESTIRVTMDEIHSALDDEQRRNLSSGKFDPDESVKIVIVRKQPSFTEDAIRQPMRRRRKPQVKSPPRSPSQQYGPAWIRWKDERGEADAKVVLGCYFSLYAYEFQEEDPEWVGKSCVKPLYNINQMAHAVCGGDFSQLVEFLETLIPLWAYQMRKGASFPSFRPSVDSLFVRRKIWAQRFNYYRQWKS